MSRLAMALATALMSSPAGAGTMELFPGGDLRAALQGLVAGDELIIHDGTYSTQSSGGSFFLAVTWNGTAANPIRVRAAPGARPVISGDFSQNVINIDGAYFSMRGLEITGGSHGLRLGNVDHAIFDDLVIHDVADVGLSCNRSGNACDALLVSNTEIYNTGLSGGTGEGLYIGCNNAACVVSNSTFTRNYLHNLGGSQADGIEIKTGSWGNTVSDNVIVGANFPGITMYGYTDVAGVTSRNVVARNFVWNTADNGIQVVGQVLVSNNIVVASGANGISSKPSQGFDPHDLEIVHNTVYQAGDGCFRGNNWGTVSLGTTVVANNAFYCEGSSVTRLTSGAGTAVFSGNVGVGAALISGIAPGNSAGMDMTNVAGQDFWPSAGSPLLGAADAQYAATDFNGIQRPAINVDVGAYQRVSAANPGWQPQSAFKTFPVEIFADGFE